MVRNLHIGLERRILLVVMKRKQTVKVIVLGMLLLGIVALLTPVTALAQGNNGCETDTAIISCENVDVSQDGIENTGVWSILLTAINILTAGVGVVAVGGVVYAAILYTSAGGNQEQVKKAVGMITNIVIGILAYALMFALLNFIVPGGLFRP
jgi:hypothetical protein